MSETIKGGAYQSADGTWRDANGKELSSKQVQEYMELQAEKAEQLAEADAVAEAVAAEDQALAAKPKRTAAKPKDKKAKG